MTDAPPTHPVASGHTWAKLAFASAASRVAKFASSMTPMQCMYGVQHLGQAALPTPPQSQCLVNRQFSTGRRLEGWNYGYCAARREMNCNKNFKKTSKNPSITSQTDLMSQGVTEPKKVLVRGCEKFLPALA